MHCTLNDPAPRLRAAKDEFFVRFFPGEGYGAGFEIPHPYCEGTITVTSRDFPAAGLGAPVAYSTWHIFFTFSPPFWPPGNVSAEIVAADSQLDAALKDHQRTSIGEYNSAHKTFLLDSAATSTPSTTFLSCAHVCRPEDYVNVRVTTAEWYGVKKRQITLDSQGRIDL